MVFFHLRIVETRYGDGGSLLPSWLGFADGGVDLFFVISGFIMATLAARSRRGLIDAGHFLRRRLWRVVPLYWLYTTLVVVVMVIAPGMVNSSYAEQDILASYLLWPQATLPVLTVGWTLIHELYFYLVMALAIALVPHRYRPMVLLGWAATIVGAQVWMPTPLSPLFSVVFNAMTLEFIGGAVLGLYWRRLPVRAAMACLPLGVVAFGLGMWGLDRFQDGLPSVDGHDPLVRTMVFGTASMLIVLGAVALETTCRWTPPRWLLAIGDSSYSLYLSHVFVVSAAGRFWSMSTLNHSALAHATFVLITVAACVVVGLLSYRLLEQPLLAWRSSPAHDSTAPSCR